MNEMLYILIGVLSVIFPLLVVVIRLDVERKAIEDNLKVKAEFDSSLKTLYKACKTIHGMLIRTDYIPTTPEEAARLADLIYIINTAEIIIKRPIAWKLMRIDGLSNEEIEAIAKGIRNYERTPESVYQDIWRIAIVNWNGESK